MGFASAPFNPEWALKYPRRAAWMALAGPATNLALAIVAALVLRVGVHTGVFYAPDRIHFGVIAASELSTTWSAIARFVSVVFSMNLLLCFWTTPMLSWLGLMIAWPLMDFVFDPMFTAAVNLIYPGVRYG